MKLLIDTSDRQKIKVQLGAKQRFRLIEKGQGQKLLNLIDRMLREHQFSIKRIKEIKVNLGPGSFTGLRVGISVANALGWALDIPVNGQKQIVLPQYDD